MNRLRPFSTRCTRAALGGLAAAFAAAPLALLPAGASAQSMFRGDAAHTGVAASAAPRQLPRERWRFATGERIVGSPVWHAGLVIVGSDDGAIYAVDAATGTQRWMRRTDGPVSGTPAVADGRLYITSYDGRLWALDAANGEVLWKFATEGERRFEARGLHGQQPRQQTFADAFDVYLSSPVVQDGRVFFGSGDGHVYALDAASGALRWKHRTGNVVHASPALGGGRVVVGGFDGALYALDAQTGALHWRFQGGLDPLMHNQQGFQSSPAIAGGTVYVGARDAHVYALDLSSGTERWRFSTGASWVNASPAVHAGQVVFATSDSARWHVLDAASGQPLQEHSTGAYVFGSPVVAGDVVLMPVLNGSLVARDRISGALLWTWRTEAAQANRGWVLTADGRFNAPWLFPGGWHDATALGAQRQFGVGSLFATPLVVDGAIYVASADGWLYSLR